MKRERLGRRRERTRGGGTPPKHLNAGPKHRCAGVANTCRGRRVEPRWTPGTWIFVPVNARSIASFEAPTHGAFSSSFSSSSSSSSFSSSSSSSLLAHVLVLTKPHGERVCARVRASTASTRTRDQRPG